MFRVAFVCCLVVPLVSLMAAEKEAEKPKRLALAEAEKQVRAFIFADKPAMNPKAEFPVKELTTDEVWDKLGVQVFQVTEGVQAHETFVVAPGRVVRIGVGFGGRGVRSLCVAELNGDGRSKLVYSFSWGSGTHRSQVGVYDLKAKEPRQLIAGESYFSGVDDDLMVERQKDGTVAVKAAKRQVGVVGLEGKDDKTRAIIVIDVGLPDEIKKRFRSTK